MRPFCVTRHYESSQAPTVLEVTPIEVVMSVDGCAADSSVSYFPTRACMAVDGHVIRENVCSLEQAVGVYAMMLHESGRLKGKVLGYILPCISISYGTGIIAPQPVGDDGDIPL